MSERNRIAKFNEENKPFLIVDHGDVYSLFYVLHPTPSSYMFLGQEAFNRYAQACGENVVEDGVFTHGNGYEWETVFKKAFEDDPRLSEITYDCEAGGFFFYCKYLDVLEDMGRSFRALCNDPERLAELVATALREEAMGGNIDMRM